MALRDADVVAFAARYASRALLYTVARQHADGLICHAADGGRNCMLMPALRY